MKLRSLIRELVNYYYEGNSSKFKHCYLIIIEIITKLKEEQKKQQEKVKRLVNKISIIYKKNSNLSNVQYSIEKNFLESIQLSSEELKLVYSDRFKSVRERM